MGERGLQLFGGDWTERKLDALDQYLRAHSKALSKTRFHRIYIDTFAGTGYREQKASRTEIPLQIFEDELEELSATEPQQFLDGSAKVALKVQSPCVSQTYIERVFDVMRRAEWHQFQVLTKRAERLERLSRFLNWAPNIWMGVSVESAPYAFRIDCLRRTGAAIKFLSIEPLLGPVGELDLSGINWVMVGGESGPHARPMQRDWVLDIQRRCRSSSVAFFFYFMVVPMTRCRHLRTVSDL